MQSAEITKCCPLCAEQIKATAKICPFCLAPQTRFARWRQLLGPLISAAVLLGMVIFVGIKLFPATFQDNGRPFAPHRNDLLVERTSLEPAKRWLVGYVTNTGPYAWRVQDLEVRFVKDLTNLVDVRHSTVSEPFIVQPHQEQAFRANLGPLTFTNSDIALTVRVQTATDGNRSPKAD